ncbi:MAG: hypothetical protein U0892_07325 [Pirellulales bacterium]
MNRTLIALWVTILGAVVTVVVLGELWAAQREQNARSGLQSLLAQQLIPYNRDIARVVDDLQRKLDDALGDVNPNDLSGLDKVKELPPVGQVVVVSAKGQVLAPRGQAYDALDESLIGDAVLLLRDQDFGRSTSSSIRSSPVPIRMRRLRMRRFKTHGRKRHQIQVRRAKTHRIKMH